MPQVEQYAPGTPSWVDVSATDVGAAARFYGDLFGWEAHETGTVEETGGYVMLTLGGRYVAGLGPAQPGIPPSWTTYVSVADARATAEAVRAGGGTVLLEPLDVMQSGTMAMFADPAGAVIAVWQPKEHPGAQVVNEPGALCWNELATRDPGAVTAFYAGLFGWATEASDVAGADYTTWNLDGRGIAGMIRMDENWPAELPSYWGVYFAVEDCDAAVERATGLGATVHVPPRDLPVGRFAALGDPQGAGFMVIALAPEMGA